MMITDITKEKIDFHEASHDDLQRIAEIQIENHLKYDHPLDRMMNNLFLNEYKKRWEKKLRDGMFTLIISVRQLTVGFITYTISKEAAEIHNIYIMPAMRRHELGKILFLQSLEKMRRASVTKVTTWIVEGRNRIIEFYHAMGFRKTNNTRQDEMGENIVLTETQYEFDITS